MADRDNYWDQVHSSRDEREVSWYQDDPELAGRLAAAGFTDLTVVDVSAAALEAARTASEQGHGNGEHAGENVGDRVTRIIADLLD